MSDPLDYRNAGNLALALLESLDAAVLRRHEPGQYSFFGLMPRFYAKLFSCSPDQPNVTPWEQSDMLRFFLDDAEAFFSEKRDGSLVSGSWQEDGVEEGTALTVSAISIADNQLLVLRRLSDDYIERTRILQKAREHLLERRLLASDLELYKRKSMFDGLTGLYNRAAFMEALHKAVAHSSRTGAPLSLLFLDIDDFKSINDTYGHLAGDAVLSDLGRLLRSYLRREDLPARYGGEEFAIIAPNTSLPQSLQVAEKVRRKVAEHDFGIGRKLTISIGCTIYRPGEDSRDFISRADMALYDAKHAGKNTVCQRDPWMPDNLAGDSGN